MTLHRFRRREARRARARVVGASLAFGALGALVGPVRADARDVLAPVEARVIAAPHAVPGADDHTHLAYEIRLSNLSPSFVDLDEVRTLGPGGPVDRVGPRRLPGLLSLDGGKQGVRLAPGAGATLFMHVRFRRREAIPARVRHRFELTLRAPTPDGGDPSSQPGRGLSFTGVPTRVRRDEPAVIAAPVRGARWLVGNGCCEPINAHRGAVLPIDGHLHAAERFAIDFVQLDAQHRLFTGENALENYPFFGDPVHAAVPGRIVLARNDQPEQIPGKLPADATIDTADGNYVVQDIGGGRYALYAHMQPGSVRVRPGDRVRTGQVLGLLGNSGNTDAPHLHFHVMDRPSPLNANGLPYVFRTFRGQGRVTDKSGLFTGDAAPVDPTALAGRHTMQLPLDDQLVDFRR